MSRNSVKIIRKVIDTLSIRSFKPQHVDGSTFIILGTAILLVPVIGASSLETN